MIPRIIARLDIKNSNLVKGVHLEGLRVLGDPKEYALHYYDQGADEIMFQDVVASLYDRNQLIELITYIANNVFIPITVGGGIKSIVDIEKILTAGADKVSINTKAIKNPDFIYEAAKKFGSSTISITVETIKDGEGEYYVYAESGREYTGLKLLNWVKQVQELGAGELIITSVDNEGTGEGFDLTLMKMVNRISSIPVIAHGGAGSVDHIYDVINKCKVDAVMIASLIHFDFVINRKSKPLKEWGNTSFINNPTDLINHSESLVSIKNSLGLKGIDVR